MLQGRVLQTADGHSKGDTGGVLPKIPFIPYLRVSLVYGRCMMYSLKCRTLTHAH